MPLLNFIYKSLKKTIEITLIDLPDLTPAQKTKIAIKVADYAKDIITESIAKTAEHEIQKAR